ncbi:hypothetical protein EMIHUDRAFT_119914, partial [Emiliania huxleyi CCMP1516]|uniref:Sugar phosphate transporter domain-containing protein n=2 Tax=Emiliania huxleyi TaxID=2903 RepID=A0A0D3IPU1_EMIH1
MRSDTSQHAVYLSFNFAAAVCIVLINKAVFSRINFGFSTTLTLAHYVLNIAGLEALRLCGAFELRPLPLNTSTAVLTVVVGAAPAINNLALKLNDVGFYTTCKLLVTPCIVVLELALFSKRVSLVRGLCLAGVCAGVGAASVSDFSLNLPGLLASLGWARLAAALAARVPIAAAYKVLWSRVAKGEAGGEPWHTLALMRAVLPWSTLVIGAMVPLVDPPGLLQYEWTVERAALLGASSAGAFLVNWSGFLCTNPGARAGQLKSSAGIIGGWLVLGQIYPLKSILGASLAVLSVGAYTRANLSEADAARAAKA